MSARYMVDCFYDADGGVAAIRPRRSHRVVAGVDEVAIQEARNVCSTFEADVIRLTTVTGKTSRVVYQCTLAEARATRLLL